MLQSFRFSLNKSFLAAAAFAVTSPFALAADGTWTFDGGSNWSETGSWAGGTVADGSGFTANFTNDITADRTVTLNTARTIGNLVFGDADTGTAGSWIVAGTNALTLAGGTPTITVNALGTGKTATISANVSGTAGLTKAGTGTLVLSGSGTNYTGATTVNAGVLELTGTTGYTSTTTVNNGATLKVTNSALQAMNAAIILNNGATLTHNGLTNGNDYWTNSQAVTVASGAAVTLNEASVAATGVQKNAFLDGGLRGGGSGAVVTINATNAGNAFSLRNNNSNFQGTIVVNGIANATSNLGSGIAVGGCVTGLQNADIQLNGTMEMSNAGLGWAAGNGGTINIGALSGTGVAVSNGGAATLVVGNTNNSGNFTGVIAGAVGITKIGTGTQTISGANTFTGATTLTDGTLVLNYGTSDTSKLANAAALNLNGGTLTLGGATGAHLEVVANTALGGFTVINRSGANTAKIALGAITRSTGSSLDVSSTGLATTTTALVNGLLQGVTINGVLATKDVSNNIIAYTAFTNVNRLGGVIADAAANNVRIIDGGASGNVTTGATVTTINTLSNAATAGLTTVDIGAGKTLRLGALGTITSASDTQGLTINNGTLTAGGAANTAGEIQVINQSAVATTIGSVIADNGTGVVSLSKSGTGTLVLSGANTYTGKTYLSGGVTQITADNNLGAAPLATVADRLTFSGGTLRFGAAFNLSANRGVTINAGGAIFDTNGFNSTLAQVVAGTGVLTKTGTGTLTLSAVNTYTGGTTINGGTLKMDLSARTGSLNLGTITTNTGGTLELFSTNNALEGTYLGAGTVLTGSGTIVKTGGGYLSVFNNGSIANFSGTLDVQQGVFGTNNLGLGTGAVDVNVASGAYLDIRFGNASIDQLGGSGRVGSSFNSTVNLSVGNDNGSSTFDGVIENGLTGTATTGLTAGGTLSLTKNGTGTLTLTGVNTYTGATTINGGTLALSGGRAIADTGTVTLANVAGVTLLLNADETIGSLAGGGTTGGSVNLQGNTLTAGGNNASTTFGGVMSGTGGFTKAGTGTFTLSGANTYTGTTTISGGVLALSGGSAIADTGDVVLANATGAALRVDTSETIGKLSGGGSAGGNVTLQTDAILSVNSGDSTYSGVLSGNGGLAKTGTGTLTLLGANNYAGTTTIASGTAIRVGNGGTTGSIGSGAVTLDGTLTYNRSDDFFVSNDIAGGTGGVLEQRGSGTLILSGANTYSGLTHVVSGVIELGSSDAHDDAASGAIQIDEGAIFDANGFDFTATSGVASPGALSGAGELRLGINAVATINQTAASTTFAGVISENGTLLKTGAGTLVLTGANTFTGSATVNGGVLQLGDGGSTGSMAQVSSVVVGASGTLAFNRSGSLNFSTNISGAGGVTQRGPAGSVVTLSGTNSYTGLTHVVSGTLRLGSAGAFNGGGDITIDTGATFDTGDTNLAINLGTTALNGGGTLLVNAGHLTVTNDADAQFDGVITGSGNFTKQGAGDFTLTNSGNTFGGTLTVSAGNLILGGAAGTITSPAGLVTVNSPGGLVFDHTDATTFAAKVNGTGTVIQRGPGATTMSGLVSGGIAVTNEGSTGAFTLSATGNLGTVTNAGTTIIRADSAAAAAGTATVAGISNTAGTLTVGSNVTGAVTVSGGKVVIGADQSDTYAKLTGTSTTVQTGGTLAFGGAGSYSVTGLTATGGVIEQAGAAGSVVTLTGANSLDSASTVRMKSGTLAITEAANVGLAVLEMDQGNLQVGVTGGSLVSLSNAVHAVDNTLSYLTGLSDVNLTGPLTGRGVIRYKGPGVLTAANEAAWEADLVNGGQIIRDGETLDIRGIDAFGATNFDDNINVTNNGGADDSSGNFVVTQNQDGTASGVFSDGTRTLGLVKEGPGMLTLTGANTYTGTTTVNGGVLRIGNGTTVGTIANSSEITINAGGTLAYDHSDDISVSNLAAVNGGTLSQRGTGIVTLTENTTVGNITGTGRLKVDTALIVDTSTGAVKSGDTFAGVLMGPGTLTKRGAGTLIISGDGALATTTRVEGGTLQLGNGGTSGSLGTGDIALSGGLTSVIAFDRSDAYVFGARITGSGTLLQEGTGTLILTGTNTFSGKTVIASGSTLQIGNGGTTGRLGGGLVEIAENGLLAFYRAGDLSFTNPITGAGSVEQRGPGTLTFTGSNTYSGETRVVNGTLKMDTSSLPTGRFVSTTSTVTGALTTGTLILNGTGEGTVRNGIAGEGHVRFTGNGGVTTLLGDSSEFSGDMNVESGHTLKLGVAGTPENLGSANNATVELNVLLGGKLSGTGTIYGDLRSRGTISPGYSPGVITVTGNFESLGTLNMEIAGSNTTAGASDGFDQVQFGGQATLGGTLNVTFTNGFAPAVGFRRVLLQDTDTSDGKPSFIGDFSTVNVVGGAGRLIRGADALIFFNGSSLAQIPGLQLHEGARPFVDALSAGPTPHPAFARFLLISDPAALSRELQNASPLGLAALTAMPTMQANRDADEIRRRAEAQTITATMPFGDDADWLVYAGGAGYMLENDNGSSSPTFDTRSYGGSVGLERRLGDGAVAVGLRLGYDRGAATLRDGGGKVDQDHGRGLLYATAQLGDNGYITGGLGMGYSTYETRRNTIGVVNADGSMTHVTQKASPTGWDLSASVDGGYIFRLDRAWSVTPHAGFTLTQAQVGGFTERGSDLALTVDGYSQTSARTRLGTGVYREWHSGYKRAGISLGFDVSYEHTLFGDTADIPASFAQSPQSGSFKTEAPALIKDSLVLGPQLRWMIGEASTITAGYRFELGFDGSTGHRGDIAFEQRF